jgi:hypothetical protein
MNNEARNYLLKCFVTGHHLQNAPISEGLADIICAVSAPYGLFLECLDQLDPEEPTGGIVLKLAQRVHTTAQGALCMVAIGHRREAEILSRSIYESASTLYYILQTSPQLRLVQFLNSYIRQEREQNRKWKEDLKSAPEEIRDDHLERIADKSKSLDSYQTIVGQLANSLKLDSGEVNKWEGLIDRLTSIGRRVEYRTVYAAMCSQAHHDAEDVLNFFIANSVDIPNLYEDMEDEADTFALFMVLFSMRWFVEAMLAVAEYLKMPTVLLEAAKSLKRIDEELVLVTSHLGKGFPENWKAEE